MKTQLSRVLMALVAAFILPSLASAKVVDLKALKSTVPIGDVRSSEYVKLPTIDWGGEYTQVYANGNSKKTTPSSILGRLGLKFELMRENDPQKMLNNYMSGVTPYFRGTADMVLDVLPEMMKDPRTAPVFVVVMTKSTGGDALGVTRGIKTITDLRGLPIGMQAHGPHMSLNYTLLQLGKLLPRDVQIVWTEGLSDPAELVRQGKVRAAYGIFPDINALATGEGGDAVAGFRQMLSTRTYPNVIFDVYVVRTDWFEANKELVYKLTMGLLQAQDKLVEIFKNPKSSEFQQTVKAFATIAMGDSVDVKTAAEMIADFTFAQFSFNEAFFTGRQFPNLKEVGAQINEALAAYGLPTSSATLRHADWDYKRLRAGGSLAVQAERAMFNPQAVEAVVQRRQAQGTLEETQIFPEGVIYFKLNQTSFSASQYQADFDELIVFLQKLGGAVVVIEGHTDPSKYNKYRERGESDVVLRKIEQEGRQLSRQRAVAVRQSIMSYAESKGILLDQSQFTVSGVGLDKPAIAVPTKRAEAELNMRVVFRVLSLEAEEDVWAE